ncbi:MAG: arabinose efflux permease family protein [Acidimicrobiales bacterium]|nr:arabinose efflux permease family protein [Acidimicrobiales bacterium]
MKRRLGNATRDTFRSLSVRNFRLFFTGQFITQVGNWLTMIALALLVLDRTGSGVAVGLLVACQFGPVLLFGAWAGLVADRSDKRRLLLIVQTVAMAQSFALATLAFMHHAPIASFYVVAALGGFATAFDNPARRSYVVELVPQDHVQNAVSLNSAVMTSSRIFGPALAGLLISTVGYGWCFLVDAISYIGVLVALWMIDPAKVRSGPLAARGKAQVRAGLSYVRQVPVLWISLAMMAIVGTLTFNFQVVFPLFVKKTLGGSTIDFTLIYAVTSIGSLIGALATARRKTVDLRDVVLTTAAFGIAMSVLAVVPNLASAYPIVIVVGLTSIAFMTTSTAIVQLRADPAMRGRVLALQAMVFLGSTPIGGPILGVICDAFGARAGVAVGGAAALGAAAWGAYMLRRVHPTATVEPDKDLVASGAELSVAS